MDDLLQSLALILLMGSILLRLDALFFLYKKRGEVDVLPGLILSLLAPIVGLSVFGYVTSKGFDDESRGRTGVGRAFKGILLFLISQMAAGWFFLSVTFVSLLTVPTGRAVGPVASAEGFAHLELLLILAASASMGLSLFWIFYGGFDLKSMIQGRKVGMYSAISFFIFLVLTALITIVMGVIGVREEAVSSQVFPRPDGFAEIFIAVLSIAVLAPLIEEIIFRGYIFEAVEKKAGGYIAVLLTALAFSIMHFSPVLVLPIFLMGLAMGWVRERSGSIIPSLVFHSANNLSAVVVLSLS